MDIWESLRTPPPEALKGITGGRLNGKTDISPQWRIKAMTQVFGPCGLGWRYEIFRTWETEGTAGQRLCFVEVHLYIKQGETWSYPIPGVGGDFILEQDRNGIYNNDEGYKMATTDALGNAMKYLGMASDVYEGMLSHAGSKYARKDQPPKPQAAKPAPPPQKQEALPDPWAEVKELLENTALVPVKDSVAARSRAMYKADSSAENGHACVIYLKEQIAALKGEPTLDIF